MNPSGYVWVRTRRGLGKFYNTTTITTTKTIKKNNNNKKRKKETRRSNQTKYGDTYGFLRQGVFRVRVGVFKVVDAHIRPRDGHGYR